MTSSLIAGPLIVGLGGTLRPDSSTETALRLALEHAETLGARTRLFDGAALDLPTFPAYAPDRTEAARALTAALAEADGVLVASPGYHGSVSGHVKNALDYAEDLADDARPYLSGRAVGCISTASGWQAAVTTLTALRGVVHALRGWPTPLGVAINAADGGLDAHARAQLQAMAAQVVEFAGRWRG